MYGGVAMMWHKSLSSNIQRGVNLGNDRICVIKLSENDKTPLYIIGVYLPQRECVISQFDDYLYNLEYIIEKCKHDGNVAIFGDFNCHFGSDYGPRAWRKPLVMPVNLNC